MLITDAEIIQQEEILPGYYRVTLSAFLAAIAAKPGQFLHVRCGSTLDPVSYTHLTLPTIYSV